MDSRGGLHRLLEESSAVDHTIKDYFLDHPGRYLMAGYLLLFALIVPCLFCCLISAQKKKATGYLISS